MIDNHEAQSEFAELTAKVRERAEALRSELIDLGHGATKVVAVTKGHPRAVVDAALAAGLDELGENYAQELIEKARADDVGTPTWHFIGGLQSKKVKALAPYVGVWQSVDRQSVLDQICRHQPTAKCFIQVNLSGGDGRSGCAPAEVADLVQFGSARGISIAGVMGVASQGAASQVESEFKSLVRLADDLGLSERCFGMSGDYRIALECGSTMIRIGQRLFGERQPRRRRE